MIKSLLLILLLSLIGSCGLKMTEHVAENVILGTWEIQRINCYHDKNSDDIVESYEFESSMSAQVSFVAGSRLNYFSTGACSTSSTGIYGTDFNGTSTGIMNLSDIITGGTTCREDLLDLGPSTLGLTDVEMTLSGLNTKELEWLVDKEAGTLVIETFTGFAGSTSTLACAEQCYCESIFLKN